MRDIVTNTIRDYNRVWDANLPVLTVNLFQATRADGADTASNSMEEGIEDVDLNMSGDLKSMGDGEKSSSRLNGDSNAN